MQTPTSGQPNRVCGILPDVQCAPVLSLKAFNIDKPIVGKQGGKPPGFLAKILGEMGFTTQNVAEGLTKARQAGDAEVAQNAAQLGQQLQSSGVQVASHEQIYGQAPGGGSWANYVNNRGPRSGGIDLG